MYKYPIPAAEQARFKYLLSEIEYKRETGSDQEEADAIRELQRQTLFTFPWLRGLRNSYGRKQDGTIYLKVYEDQKEFLSASKEAALKDPLNCYWGFGDENGERIDVMRTKPKE